MSPIAARKLALLHRDERSLLVDLRRIGAYMADDYGEEDLHNLIAYGLATEAGELTPRGEEIADYLVGDGED